MSAAEEALALQASTEDLTRQILEAIGLAQTKISELTDVIVNHQGSGSSSHLSDATAELVAAKTSTEDCQRLTLNAEDHVKQAVASIIS